MIRAVSRAGRRRTDRPSVWWSAVLSIAGVAIAVLLFALTQISDAFSRLEQRVLALEIEQARLALLLEAPPRPWLSPDANR